MYSTADYPSVHSRLAIGLLHRVAGPRLSASHCRPSAAGVRL